MLRQRILTAIVLFAVLFASLLASAEWPFALLALVGISAAGWEWARLNQAGDRGALVVGAALGVACLAALLAGWARSAPAALWWLGAVGWVVGGSWALNAGPLGWPRLAQPLRLAVGIGCLWTAWLAMANAKTIGNNYMLSVLALVWVADIAAYFGGRAFGRRKLAPSISPGKSWAGVWSGLLAVQLLAPLWLWFDHAVRVDSPSIYSTVGHAHGYALLAGALLLLAAMSVVGDLIESLAKRSAGAKDSSGLLPGHGGVLDRIDALLPVFPMALAMVSV